MESYGVHDFGLSPLLIYVVLCGVDSTAHGWDLSDRGIWISWCEVPANIWHAPAEGECEGRKRHGTLPVRPDCFPSTYTWAQNILFFISLHYKCGCFLFFVFFLVWLKNAELLLLRFCVWCSMLDRWTIKVESFLETQAPSHPSEANKEIPALTFEMAHAGVNILPEN